MKGRKTGGRKAGTPNKVTVELREAITGFLEEKFPELIELWEKMSPERKTKLYCDLLAYSVPKLQNTTLKTDLEKLSPDDWERLADMIIQKL